MNKAIDNIKEEEKRDYLDEHFTYEVEMLYKAYRSKIEFDKIKDTNGVNMALECFCLHARNLLEFFYSKKKTNYARIQDFVSFEITSGMNKDFFKCYFDRLSKMFHFKYDRMSSSGPREGWPLYKMIVELFKTTKTFIEHLPEKYKGDRIIKLYACISILLENH